jgi:hypothetical protein
MPTVEGEASRQMFILRFWHEPSQERPGAWRGSVDHVDSGKRFYFARLDDMQDFIRKALENGEAGQAPSSPGDVE